MTKLSPSNHPEMKPGFLSRWGWGLLLLVAVGVRMVWYGSYRKSPFFQYFVLDHRYYLEWAQRVSEGNWLGKDAFEMSPLYPYLLGLAFRLFGENFDLVFVLQMLCGVGTVVLLYFAARRIVSENIALAGALLTAIFGPLLYYETLLMKSFLSPFFTVLTFYAAIRFAEHQRWRWLILCGCAIGFACLVRENHVLLLPAVGVWLWVSQEFSTVSRKQKAAWFGGVCLVWFLSLIPSAVHNWKASGEWILVTSGGGEVFYMAHSPEADGFYAAPDFVNADPFREHEDFRREASRRVGHRLSRGEASRYWYAQGWQQIFDNPIREVKLAGKKLLILLNDFEVNDSENYTVAKKWFPLLKVLPSFGWISGLGILGIGVCCSEFRRYSLPLGLVIAHVISVLATYNFGRFRQGLLPLCCLFAVLGVTWLIQQAQEGRVPRLLVGSGAVLGLTVIAVLPPIGYSAQMFPFDDHQLLAMMALREGDEDRAEQEFFRALAEMKRFEAQGITQGTGNQEAQFAVHFGEQFLKHSPDRTRRFYWHALDLPLSEEEHRLLLHRWMQILLQLDLRNEPGVSEEIRPVLRELRHREPGRVEYWGLSSRWATAEDLTEIHTGLESAWQSSRQSEEQRIWYFTGRAFLNHYAGNSSQAVESAAAVLILAPDHPWRKHFESMRN